MKPAESENDPTSISFIFPLPKVETLSQRKHLSQLPHCITTIDFRVSYADIAKETASLFGPYCKGVWWKVQLCSDVVIFGFRCWDQGWGSIVLTLPWCDHSNLRERFRMSLYQKPCSWARGGNMATEKKGLSACLYICTISLGGGISFTRQ